MIFLCIGLIIYDIFVLIDPTRCFILNCSNANVVYFENSTAQISVTGWPLSIVWPSYFRNAMNTKRFFQSVQLCSAYLFILCCSIYILTYFNYRHFDLHRPSIYESSKKTTTSIYAPYEYPQSVVSNHDVDYSYLPIVLETERKKSLPSRMASTNSNEICRRCMKQPRMIITNDFGQRNLFSYTCFNCNNELLNSQRKSPIIYQIIIPKLTSC